MFASAGTNNDFHIIYCRLPDAQLVLGKERHVVTQLLRDHQYGLFIFSNQAQNKWHFINVKYDPEIANRQLFRRFTIGPQERLRTASQRISMIDLSRAVKDISSLSPLSIQRKCDEAFDVEAVQNDFFTIFANLYHRVAQDIAEMPGLENESGQLAQLLLNRMIFLYFIQKKGWLNQEPKYLYTRFQEYWKKDPWGVSYYSEVLYPLFQCLSNTNTKISNLGIVPFLNGGLFEEANRQKQRDAISRIRANVKNVTFKDIFDDLLEKFNFTVAEDTPLDVEVAIDPEMLGRIFESLILQLEKEPGLDLRKMTGSYYTPRTIVHFMCRQSLSEFLAHQLSGNNIDRLGENRDRINDVLVLPPADQLDDGQIEKLVGQFTIAEAKMLRQAVLDCRICDPAVGSGAFLVGMLHEMVSAVARFELVIDGGNGLRIRNYDYVLKRQIVETCIYGVDIQEQAVRLCELRLWLSLIVDYQIASEQPFDEAVREIPSLPNLSYRIVRGDSLLEHLFGHVVQLDELSKDTRTKQLIESIQSDKQSYFRETAIEEKRRTELKILSKQTELAERLIVAKQSAIKGYQGSIFGEDYIGSQQRKAKELFDTEVAQLESIKTKVTAAKSEIEKLLLRGASVSHDDLETLRRQYFQTGDSPTFMWRIDFAEVFRENGGFDIVIGNPPYINMIQMDKNEGLRDQIRSCYSTATGAFDIFIPFYELSYNITKTHGVVCLITPNKILSAEYASDLRNVIRKTCSIVNLVDAAHCQLFDAAVYPVTMLFVHSEQFNGRISTYRVTRRENDIVISEPLKCEDGILDSFPNGIWSPIFSKGVDLLANVISARKTFEEACTIRQAASVDEAYKVFRPLVCEEDAARGKKFKRFIISGSTDRYSNLWGKKRISYLKEQFARPVLLVNRNMLNKERQHQIDSSKVIVSGQALFPKAFYDRQGEFASGIPTVLLYDAKVPLGFLCGLLNSNLYREIYRIYWSTLAMSGGYMRFGPPQIKRMPLPEASPEQMDQIEAWVLSIQDEKGKTIPDKRAVQELEVAINRLVLGLFDIPLDMFEEQFPQEVRIIADENQDLITDQPLQE
ncbi:MAG: Eco57I restriction-modification methylase domain-containing protein [Dehalococcoidales bacterium]